MIDQGITSLDIGAPDITYSGNEGPKSPEQEQQMLMAQLQEEYDRYVDDMIEQGIQPMSIEQFMEQALAEGQMSEGPPLPNDPTEPVNPFGPKPIGPVLPDRQMAAFGGIMGLDQRRQYGWGSKFKRAFNKITKPFVKVSQKLMPKELAGISQMAAPFLGPVYGPLLMAAAQAKQKGRISPTALAISMLPHTKFAGGEGPGQFKPTGYGSMGEGQSLRNIFLRGESGGGAGSDPIFGKYGTKADEFLFGAKDKEVYTKGEDLSDRQLKSRVKRNFETLPDSEYLTGYKDTSGIIGSSGEAFQFGKEDGPGILDTKIGQKAFLDADNKPSMLKIGSWGLAIYSGIKAGKYADEMAAADAAEQALIDSDNEATQADLDAARAWAIETFGSMNIYDPNAEGGRIGFQGGGADMGTVSTPTRRATAKSVNVSPSGNVTTSTTKGPDGPDRSAVGPGSTYAQNTGITRTSAIKNILKGESEKIPSFMLKNYIGKKATEAGLGGPQYMLGSTLYDAGKWGLDKIKGLRSDKYDTGTLGNDFSKLSFADLGITDTDTDTDNIKLAKVYNKADLEGIDANWAGMGFGANDKLEAVQNLYEGVKKIKGTPVGSTLTLNEAKEKVQALGKIPFSGYSKVDMGLVPKDFLETEADLGTQKEPYKLFGKAEGGRINRNMGGIASMQRQDVTPPGMELDLRGGGFIPIGAQEKADDVKARVSKNEFVFTADAVKAAGGGSVNEGAKRMYDTMKRLESQVV